VLLLQFGSPIRSFPLRPPAHVTGPWNGPSSGSESPESRN
jgi:hypothetical protein